MRALLNSAEFKEEPKSSRAFLSILRTLYRTNPESFAQATESLQGRTRVILLVMKERCLWRGIILNQNKFQIRHIG